VARTAKGIFSANTGEKVLFHIEEKTMLFRIQLPPAPSIAIVQAFFN
jgi:hypothetical protein